MLRPKPSEAPGISGLRVLDLAGLPGIYGTKLLADLGAEVVRIEPPAGDPLRQQGPFFHDQPGPGRSLPFAYYNTSKRSIVLDLDQTSDRQTFKNLAEKADVVFESEPPGSMTALGIGYRDIASRNPGLIWAAITPFGQTGPRAQWKANDLVAMAAGGVLYLSGMPDGPPIISPGDQAYHLGGVAAVTGLLIALRQRAATGQGQLIDVSLQAAVATATEAALGFWDSMQQIWERRGLIGLQGYESIYKCRDGWVIGALGNRWDSLLAWAEEIGIANDSWRDPRWNDRSIRESHREEVSKLARSLFVPQTMQEIYQRGQRYRVAFQPVFGLADLLTDPQLAYRGFWTSVPHDDLGAFVTYPGAPFLTTSGFWRIRRHAPSAGEHTAEVLLELNKPGLKVDSVIPRSPPMPSSKRPMAGIRIVDFSTAGTGPLATRILADHGAEVIKIEWRRRPDGARLNVAPRLPGNPSPNVSANWNALNASKRDLTVNMNLPEARALVRELIRISDVVIDNYGRDPFPKWGLTYEQLRELRPDIIMARSSVMGRTGPRNGFIGFGNGIAAAAAWNSLMGFPGDPPVGMGPAYPDFSVNCHHLLVAILTALEHRRRTGEGQYIDLSQHESTIAWIGPIVLDYIVNGRIPPLRANRHPDYAPHGVYRVAGDDRWIAIAVDDTSWRGFERVAVSRGLALQWNLLASHLARKRVEDDLDAAIAAWTAHQDGPSLVDQLQEAGVASYCVSNGQDMVEDPQLAHRKHYVQLDHPEAGKRLWERHAFLLTDAPGWPARSPLLGEDNDWVLADLLGLSENAVAQAYVQSIID